MTDISAFELDTVASRSLVDKDSGLATLLSVLLIVGFPTCFWLALLELANYALSLGISNATRLLVTGMLLSFLGLIWGFVVISTRQRRATERQAGLGARTS
ncbi:MAG: hypothetical protein ACI89J_001208 [Hyphomicrobiaceae bacterium]|jgi:hypothetical protein